MRFTPHSLRKEEQGVTILIVGFTLLALIAMAALAIDVASLYEARSEAQRAADAAAMAGAKMFVSSGYTSNSANWSPSVICQSGGPGLAAAVNVQAELAAKANLISSTPATIQAVSCNFDAAHAGMNPRVTVTVQNANLSVFFSRIWGASRGAVTATATAEAYNASGPSGRAVGLTNVKPWAVANCDPSGVQSCPSSSGYFINPADGSILNNGFVGTELLLRRETSGSLKGEGNGGSGPNVLEMYALNFPNLPAPLCPDSGAPSCGNIGSNKYIDDIACASTFTFQCGQPIGVGQTITATTSVFGPSPTREGTRCVIHAEDDGLAQGQDVLSLGTGPGTPPATITGGFHNPNPSLQGLANISRSDSIVTVPLYDGKPLLGCGGGTCVSQVSGFLQLGVIRTTDISSNPQLDVVVLNVVGCNPNLGFPSANPISPGSVSPVIVRLVKDQ